MHRTTGDFLFPASYYEKYNLEMIGAKDLIKAVPKGLVWEAVACTEKDGKIPECILT